MEKSKTQEEITKAVKECFDYNKTVEEIHVTSDGQCFLPGAKSAADLHARRNKLTVETVSRADIEKAAPAKNEPTGYAAKNVAQLTEMLVKERKLEVPKGTKKDGLIQMLEDDDARIAKEEELAKAGAEGTEGANGGNGAEGSGAGTEGNAE